LLPRSRSESGHARGKIVVKVTWQVAMREIAEFVSALSCAVFTGAPLYVNFVEHPARM
jgi:hypothetical protein